MARRTKEHIIKNLEALGASKDDTVENVWWLNGHCFLLKQNAEGNWEIEEL